jgi:hypothetical protein
LSYKGKEHVLREGMVGEIKNGKRKIFALRSIFK